MPTFEERMREASFVLGTSRDEKFKFSAMLIAREADAEIENQEGRIHTLNTELSHCNDEITRLHATKKADALIAAQKDLIDLYAVSEDDGWPVDIHERERLRAEIRRLEG